MSRLFDALQAGDIALATRLVTAPLTRKEAVATGRADLIAFGRPFIANPDLGRRLREGAPLNALDPKTLYGGAAPGYTGYTGYPALDAAIA